MSQVEEEERQRQAEEEDRRHQHLLHLKNILPAWNTQNPAPAPEAAPAPSLADIQRAQEEKERRVSVSSVVADTRYMAMDTFYTTSPSLEL